MAQAEPQPRVRRPPGEARRLLLETARRLFAAQGYAGTSTRQIASLAAVSEPLIFRYFGTKAGLFDAAMVAPFQDFIDAFIAQWQEELRRPERVEAVTTRFVVGLYEIMRENRQLFLALIAARAFDSEAFSENGENSFESELSRQLDRFDELLRRTTPTLPPKYLDSVVAFRLVLGAVMASSVLDDWLFPAGPNRPSTERILQELTQFTLYGVHGKRPKR